MYCPYCRSELKAVPIETSDDIDWDDPKQVDKYMTQQDKKNGAVDMLCTGEKCCFRDVPLTFHHSIYGINHKPGDSWSLSWIE